MKVLHIGKHGNMERFSAPDSFLYKLETVDMPMGEPVDVYLDAAADADFLVADAIADIPGELIRSMPKLKLIHSEGVAFNRIDLDAADERRVYVCNCQGMNASAVAEQAVLLMCGMLKDVAGGDRAVREGRQIVKKEGYMLRGDLKELADCRIGLVGFGDIARATARLLQAYEVQAICYYRRSRLSAEEEQRLHVQYLPLPELLGCSDIVSLHLPVTEATRSIADDSFFGQMKDGSYFVNTARGELVDDDALIRALSCGKLAMAGLDTLDREPVQPDHPLLQLSEDLSGKILFSPHIGGITASSFRRGYAYIWEDIEAAAAGQRPKRVRNRILF